MFSRCPSIRLSVLSLKYPLSTCTWVCWSTRPIVTILQHVRLSVRPSVRLERFPVICWRMHGGNGLKFCMLMYLGHLQNWLYYGRGLLSFLLLAVLRLSETGQIWSFLKFCMQNIITEMWARQNGCHFADDIFKCIFFNPNVCIFINISPNFIPNVQCVRKKKLWKKYVVDIY